MIRLITLVIVCAVYTNSEECPTLAKSCSACIIQPSCAWCTNQTFDRRCDTVNNLIENGCYSYENPQTIIETIRNDTVADGIYANDEDDEPITPAIQIQPQRISLKIRQGETKRFRVKIRQALNYPVDLYYLMDLSGSMRDDLVSLKGLAREIADGIKGISRRSKLGFGSFVDKPMAPYINITASAIDEPCSGCEKAYSFRNFLPLNQDVSQFVNNIEGVIVSSNLDGPEGTFDAIMQAAVCTNKIGWRENARHLLLLTTDASFHIQGDGRVAGVIIPNDGMCHLDQNMEYNMSHVYDYPSVGSLNEVLVAQSIIPIFAVTYNKASLFEQLRSLVESARVATLSSDSRNVVSIIGDTYREITGSIELTHNAPPNLQLDVYTNCRSDISSNENKNICKGISLGDELAFDIDVTARGCMPGENNISFDIYPVGLDERLHVNVEVYCDCPCTSFQEPSSSLCSDGNGTLSCGKCLCNEGRYGKFCDCEGSSQDEAMDTSLCKPHNHTNVICSGRGECICGECLCRKSKVEEEQISGTFCECSNKKCPMYNGEVCGGSERGACICDRGRISQCECKQGYNGKSCECVTSTSSCIFPKNGLLCNAEGTCKCGACSCGSTTYNGKYCEECVTCTECDLHVNCVQCKIFNEGLTKDECEMCSQIIEEVEELPSPDPEIYSECSYTDDNKCSIEFVYTSNDTVQIYVKSKPQCPTKTTAEFPLFPVIIGIALAVVLIGFVLIVIFKLYQWYLDKKEYEQLLLDQANAKWDKTENPLYEQGTKTYMNPMFGKPILKP